MGAAVPVGKDIANYGTLSRNYARPQNSALLLTAVSDLTLEKRASHGPVNPGETLAYTITVGGSGSLAPTEVYVQDAIPLYTSYQPGTATVPAGFELFYSTDYAQSWQSTQPGDPSQVTHLRWYAHSIGAGVRVPLGYAVQINKPIPMPNTVICNRARAWSAQTPQLNSQNVCVPTLDVYLTTAYDGPLVVPGQAITITLAYGNRGSGTARDTVLVDVVPDHTTFDRENSTLGWTCAASAPAGTPCTLDTGDLPPQASGIATYTVAVTDPLPAGVATLLNTGNISSVNGIAVSSTLSIPVVANAELVVLKSDGVRLFLAGDTLTYTLSLTNAGNQGASGIVITDTLPNHTTLIPGSASHGGVYWPTNRQVVWTISPSLPGYTAISRTLRVQVNNPLPDDTIQITNTARVADDGANGDTAAGNVSVDVNTLDFDPSLRIAKYGPAYAEIGDTVGFTFTVSTVSFTPTAARITAIGDGSPIRDIQVYDSIAGPASLSHGDDGDGLLEIGELWVYTARYTLKSQDRGTLVNIGTAIGRDINGDLITATSRHTTIVSGPALYLPLVVRNN